MLAFQTQVLTEKECSLSTDVDTPRNEWGGGSVALEFPTPGGAYTLVRGLRVIAVKKRSGAGDQYSS
jgi:hypothetical protein